MLSRILARPFAPRVNRSSACLGMRRSDRDPLAPTWRRSAPYWPARTGGAFHCLRWDRSPLRSGLLSLGTADVGIDRPSNCQRGLRGFAELCAGTVAKRPRRSGKHERRCVRAPVWRNFERSRFEKEIASGRHVIVIYLVRASNRQPATPRRRRRRGDVLQSGLSAAVDAHCLRGDWARAGDAVSCNCGGPALRVIDMQVAACPRVAGLARA